MDEEAFGYNTDKGFIYRNRGREPDTDGRKIDVMVGKTEDDTIDIWENVKSDDFDWDLDVSCPVIVWWFSK